MTHTQTVMLRLLTMCIPFRNLRKKWRTFLRDFLSDYDRDARRSMRAWRRHPVAGRTILILEPNYCHGEIIPGFCRHLLDMGYRVDVLMHHSLARQSPLCCFKEGDIHIFTAMCTSWKRLAKARVLTRYEAILVSTSAFYDIPGWASFLHMTGLDKFANLLAVEHELKDIPRFGEEELDRQGRLLTLSSFPRGMMVNPHFFGEIPPAPRNREPVFITVGSLSAQRKNHELLVEALETVCNEGYRNFSVIIVGEGELGKIPGHLRPFLHVAGKLDFPAMYEAMRRADYFLPLLDPGNPAHNRYITTGVTGSAQLVYGFAKIPVIHEKFASFYGFNDRNALLYREETLGGAMLRAIIGLPVTVSSAILPNGLWGCYDDENHVILIDRRLTYTAKRCTLVHELLHWRHGDTGCSNDSSKLERRARTQTALTLVNPTELALLERMYEYEWQIADELNVTTQVLEDYRSTLASS